MVTKGDTLGRYRVLEELGKGGFGTVYKAEHTRLGYFCAIKVMHEGLAGVEVERKRFEREAEVMARLCKSAPHAHIVNVTDLDETDDDVPYIVMEYVPHSVADHLDEAREESVVQFGATKTVSIEQTIEWMLHACDGLAHAHDNGVTHRDIKPANLLIAEDGVLKLGDFGLAKLPDVSILSYSDMAMGTIAYASPEQLDNAHDADHRTDVYALGRTLFELLAGRLPAGRRWRPPSSYNENVPEALDKLVEKATEDEREDRHQSIAELKDAILEADRGRRRATRSGENIPAAGESSPSPAKTADGATDLRAGATRVNLEDRAQPRRTQSNDGDRSAASPEAARLIQELDDASLSHERRRDIGTKLAEIGDPRPGVGVKNGVPDIDWVSVSPGGSVDIEGTQKKVEPFYIARYPITYAQYKAFVEASDEFQDPQWWRDMDPDYCPPNTELSDQKNQLSNAPRDNVSWYQAVALTRWLNAHLALRNAAFSSGGALVEGADWEVRLPTEWEWQWAAQGGTEEREYPWGSWQKGLANTFEAGLGNTTAVGMYPAGASAHGALDMCGNAWQWCLNVYRVPHITLVDESGEYRALRGGSFDDPREYAASSVRNRSHPYSVWYDLGFRVGLFSPLDPGL